MKKLRIIFFGTPKFAVDSLHKINLKYIVNCVVTSPDRKAGRGQKMNQSEVKKYAKENNIDILQPENLNDKYFVKKIKELRPDLIVIVAFKKLPTEIFSIPPLGTINLHASLLPDYRGAAPINWCLINNEVKTGVTTFYINEKIDHGDILLKEEVNVEKNDDFGSLHDKLSSVGSRLLVKTIEGIINKSLVSSSQPLIDDLKLAPKLTTKHMRIDWSKSVKEIIGKIRGLSPSPGSWTLLKNNKDEIRVKILKAEESSKSNQKESNGKLLVENGKIYIVCKDGIINCIHLQLENRREMSAIDLLNGYKFHKNSYVY
tara:strand:+ start:466 stop:1413 length:948 start_codon:yes stop_codon:yes gene_type:complete